MIYLNAVCGGKKGAENLFGVAEVIFLKIIANGIFYRVFAVAYVALVSQQVAYIARIAQGIHYRINPQIYG
jgi:hypothetical protein